MKFVIGTARDSFLVRDEASLRRKFEQSIARKAAAGMRIRVHESSAPKVARVNFGRWLFDCECGSGVVVDPEFSSGYCFGCGAVHTAVRFPKEDLRLNVEHILLARPNQKNRNWSAEESLLDIAIENAERGVKF